MKFDYLKKVHPQVYSHLFTMKATLLLQTYTIAVCSLLGVLVHVHALLFFTSVNEINPNKFAS